MRKVSVHYRRGDPGQPYSATVTAVDAERAIELTEALFADDRTLKIEGADDLGEADVGVLPTVVLYDLEAGPLKS